MNKCKVLVWNSKKKESEWIDGEVVGCRQGDHNESFDRIDVKVFDGVYEGCHPDCVRMI